MKAVGIIAEYNPFHNGHLWHLDQAREKSGLKAVVAVMSGNFVQRGEPALFDKWIRARMAVQSGVDLVLELPLVFAVRSAENFAGAGVKLLAALGVIDAISFGAEHADPAALSAWARALDEAETADLLKEGLERGQQYAAALGKALIRRTGLSQAMIASPNNILAVEYLRAVYRYAPQLKPVPVARRDAGYHDTTINGPIASATAIRQDLMAGAADAGRTAAAMPEASATILDKEIRGGRGPIFYRDFEQMLLARLRSATLAELAELPDVGEGLHYKIKDSALQAATLEDLFEKVKSKRYSRARLQRIAIHALLGSNREQFRSFDTAGPLYARVLAFNDTGRSLLRQMRKHSSVPVITKTTLFLNSWDRDTRQLSPLEAMLATDTLATDLYVLAAPLAEHRRGGLDFRTTPLYLPTGPTFA